MERVDFHFDVMCPWAYQTSKWIRAVRAETELDVGWRFFSLEEVNRQDGKKHPWERPWSYGWSLMRIGALLRRRSMDLLDAWYEAAGRALHEDGRKVHDPTVAAEVLEEIGVGPAAVARALDDPSTHDDVRADHDRVVARGGYGVPTLVLGDGTTLFGPVIVPAPTGERAVRLWELVKGWAEFPHLYELRRPKTAEDWDHVNGLFTPYLQARDWMTVQRPVA